MDAQYKLSALRERERESESEGEGDGDGRERGVYVSTCII